MDVLSLMQSFNTDEVELLKEMITAAYQRAHAANNYDMVGQLAVLLGLVERQYPDTTEMPENVVPLIMPEVVEHDEPEEQPIPNGTTENEIYTVVDTGSFTLKIPRYHLDHANDTVYRMLIAVYVHCMMAHGQTLGSKTLKEKVKHLWMNLTHGRIIKALCLWQKEPRLSRVVEGMTCLSRFTGAHKYTRTDSDVNDIEVSCDFYLRFKRSMRMSGPLDDLDMSDWDAS